MSNHAATDAKVTKAPMDGKGGPKGDHAKGLSTWEHEQIKTRAFALWREAGYPQGQDRELWEQAELQVLKGRPAA